VVEMSGLAQGILDSMSVDQTSKLSIKRQTIYHSYCCTTTFHGAGQTIPAP